MSIVIQNKTILSGNSQIGSSIIEDGLTFYLDPNNVNSYAGSGTDVFNIAPNASNNNISGSLDASSMYVNPSGEAAYFRVRSDSVIQRLNFSGTISRAATAGSTIMFYFWSNYDATGQYSNSQAFFGGKFVDYMALRGGSNGFYGTEAETDGGNEGNHDYFANEGGNIFQTGSWQSWTSVFSNTTGSNYYNGTLNNTTYPLVSDSTHSFNRLGSTSTGTTSDDRGGDIRMGALLIYNRALTEEEVVRNLTLLDRRFRG